MPITARPHHPHCSMATTQERGHHSSAMAIAVSDSKPISQAER